MNIRFKAMMLVSAVLLLFSSVAVAQDVEVTFLCYQDSVECDVYTDLLSRFTEDTGIAVTVDVVPYANIDEQLPIQVEAGEAPDIARITNFGIFAGQYLDASEYLDDETVAYWSENYPAPILAAMTNDGGEGLGGFPDAFTVTGPYVNRTLFELAEVDMPDAETATWEDWTTATAAVQAVLSSDEAPIYAIQVDATGHRFAGPAMSMGATLIDENGMFTVDTEGFRAMAELLNSWHEDELTPEQVWLGGGGSAEAANLFINGQVVMHMSGSWQVNRYADEIGDNFDWIVVPNPQGDGGSTGVAGGAAVAAFAQTENPEAVAQVMAYLISEEVASEFAARTNSLSANSTVASAGVEYEAENPIILDALSVFALEVPKLQDQAAGLNVHPFAFAYYRNSTSRITQYLIGELTLDEALAGLQQDIDDAVAAANE
ncbi:MAG: ABC transporter substrate-binding protein [Phototrophicaceae bacterium]